MNTETNNINITETTPVSNSNNTVELTRKMKSTLNIINSAYNNPAVVTRAQIQALVDAGDFKWPYWITDHKHGYALERGLFRLPNADASVVAAVMTPSAPVVVPEPEPVQKTFLITDPNNKAYTFVAFTADEALSQFIAARKRAKKSFSFATAESFIETDSDAV